MAAAGTQAGDHFSQGFERSFAQRIDGLGRTFAQQMSANGNLAGERFSETFQNRIRGTFRGMQGELADALVSESAFRRFAEQFESPAEAAQHLTASMHQLRQEMVQVEETVGEGEDAYTRLVSRVVLTQREMDRLTSTMNRYTRNLEENNRQQRVAAEEMEAFRGELARLNRLGRDVDAIRGLADEVGGLDEAFDRLRVTFQETADELGLAQHEIDAFSDALDQSRIRIDEHDARLRELARTARMLPGPLDNLATFLAKPWTNLDNDVRLAIVLIASAADQVGALGSAAGAGAIALGAFASQALVGLGGVVTVFSTLTTDIEQLPADLRDVKREWMGFADALVDTKTAIATSAFNEMDGVFDSLSDTVRELQPGFRLLGRAIGDVFSDFADAVRPGTKAFEALDELVRNSARGFDDLAGIVGTFGLALLEAFNGAQPLVEQFTGWMGTLADRFLAFVEGPNFDDWIGNAQSIFSSLGGLLDTTGRALNDLVTPETIGRTTDLLDGLAEFMPVLSDLLDIIGRFDLLGLAVDLLNSLGTAIEPLIPLLGSLADGLGFVAGIIINPGFAAGLLALVTSLGLIRGARGLEGLADRLTQSGGALAGFSDDARAAGDSIGRLGRAIGIGGAVIGGALALIEGAKSLARELANVDEVTRNLVGENASLADSYRKLNSDVQGNMVGPMIEDWSVALDGLDGTGTILGNLGSAFSDSGQQALALAGTLGELDKGISTLPLEDAQEQFAAWATEIGASDEQVLAMLDKMPEFKAQLEAAAAATGQLATDQDLVKLAMEGTKGALDSTQSGYEANISGLKEIADSAAQTEDQISTLAEAIRNFGDTQISTMEASANFEQSIDDLSESLTKNGTTLDLATQEGRDNQAALLDGVEAAKEHAAAIYEDTKNIDDANAVLATQKQKLIDTIKQFDAAGLEAGAYDDILAAIPDDVMTIVDADTSPAQAELDRFLRANASKTINVAVGLGGQGGQVRDAATGFLADHGPEIRRIGEAGPEAVVPLNRPLSQVDPAVRALSAFAQGKQIPSMASGGIVGGGRTINISEGAFQIHAPDPWMAAHQTVNGIVERVG